MAMRGIRPGELRQRVTIETPSTDMDEYNRPDRDAPWGKYASNVPASIEAVSGVEQWRGLRIDEVTTHAVVMRYDSGLTAEKRLDWDGVKLGIVSTLDRDGYKHSLTLQCKELTNG